MALMPYAGPLSPRPILGCLRHFSNRSVQQTQRLVFVTLWHVYSFFTNYAAIDKFEPGQIPDGWRPEAVLDRWILAELQQLAQGVDEQLDNYKPADAGGRIAEFIDVLSNWYLRRSRRRFWKIEHDADKTGAYATLYRCLTTVARLMAPLAPFVSEHIYRNLELRYDPDGPDSVHLSDYPVVDPALIDREALDAARLMVRVCRMGRAARSAAGLRGRHQLEEVVVRARTDEERQHLQLVHSQILEELNALELRVVEDDAGPVRRCSGGRRERRGYRGHGRRVFRCIERRLHGGGEHPTGRGWVTGVWMIHVRDDGKYSMNRGATIHDHHQVPDLQHQELGAQNLLRRGQALPRT